MAVLIDDIIFFHIGRTAGYWVRDALLRLDRPCQEIGAFHACPLDIDPALRIGTTSFSVVRHPLTWLRSYWMHESLNGSHNPKFHRLFSKSFEGFLHNILLDETYLEEGFATQIMRPYLDHVDVVLKNEDIKHEMELFLLEKHYTNATVAVAEPRANVGDVLDLKEVAVASEELLQRVMAVEAKYFNQFGYTETPPLCIGPSGKISITFKPISVSSQELTAAGIDCIYPRYLRDADTPLLGQISIKDYHHIAYALQQLDADQKTVIDLNGCDPCLLELLIDRGISRGILSTLRPTNELSSYISNFHKNIELVQCNIYDFDKVVVENIDIAICVNLLHNTFHPAKLFIELWSKMNNNGILYIHTYLFEDKSSRTTPSFIFFEKGEIILDEPCPGLFNEAGLVFYLELFGFKLKNKVYHYNIGPVAKSNRSVQDSQRYGPVKLVGLFFTKCNQKFISTAINGVMLRSGV